MISSNFLLTVVNDIGYKINSKIQKLISAYDCWIPFPSFLFTQGLCLCYNNLILRFDVYKSEFNV